jgi:hypothetical protein
MPSACTKEIRQWLRQGLPINSNQKRLNYIINEINALHDVSNENIRFKKLEGLTRRTVLPRSIG